MNQTQIDLEKLQNRIDGKKGACSGIHALFKSDQPASENPVRIAAYQ
jgi:hypothetical protein